MKKAKKKVKGMTLIEMIITIMIFSLMCGILVMIGTHIDSVTRSTNTIKDKLVKQSPYAANINDTYIGTDGTPHTFPTSDMDITLEWDGSWSDGSSNPDLSFDVEFEAKRYMTQDVVLDGRTEKSKEYITNGPNAGINLDFISKIKNKASGEEVDEKAHIEEKQAEAAAAATSTTSAAPIVTTVTTVATT